MLLSAFRRLIWSLLLLAAVATPARAQDIFAVPYAGVKFGGDTSIVDLEVSTGRRMFSMGGSIVVLGTGVLGYEADFGYVPSYFENDDSLPLIKPGSYAVDLTGAVILALPDAVTRGGLRPYVVVGVGLISAQAADFLEIFLVRRTVPAFKIGVGAQALLLTNNVGIRFDLRHVRVSIGTGEENARLMDAVRRVAGRVG